jgi:hypothetical protein
VERLGRERAEALRTRRWNIREDNGDLYICRAEHEKSSGCEERRFVPAERLAAAEADRDHLQRALNLLRDWGHARMVGKALELAAKEGT